ncbi:MAG: hypothetical protein DCC68_24765 [Planctomycetota bacterium]|nr:MAG: hypothetical protein DCC68_24765 [Planctomycetota bacterium]
MLFNPRSLGNEGDWDSWELFIMISIDALREGGRLALVLPDSFFYPQKARTRKRFFEEMTVEKVFSLGPDWFGPDVRMGTIVVQARRGRSKNASTLHSIVLSGALRQQAIRGQIPLSQIESTRSREIPVARVLESPTYEIEVFRSIDDDRIMAAIAANSVCLSGADGLCERARGEEINKAGLLWVCPSCLSPTTPGRKVKGGAYADKACEKCGHLLRPRFVDTDSLIVDRKPKGAFAPFIDGDDIARRYCQVAPRKWLRLGVPGWEYKDDSIYRSPKILLRQAGVGVFATLDETEARCPQSVYIYRLRDLPEFKGYKHEFVLAALLSRTVAYVVFKRFAEVDPAKAHAKLTHERIADLPIPRVDFRRRKDRTAHDAVVSRVRSLLEGKAQLGGTEDREIEQILREFWNLSADDGAYINGEFFDLPEGQAITDLFPNGRPKPFNRELETA